jgi:DNA polymerase III subunit delta
MRITASQLNADLARKIKPVYLICGDEPLQAGEAADAIRYAAKQAGFLNREILTAEGNFDWKQLAFAAASDSIFADKKILDVRVPSGKFGTDGGKAVSEYCDNISADTLLLINTVKLDGTTLKSKWVQAVDKIGVIVQVFPLEGQELLQWLQQRLLKRGLQVDSGAVKMIAARIEGNLLAAVQEIEKLYVLYGTGQLSAAMIEEAVSDSSRFDVFKLAEAFLAGKANRTCRILAALKEENVAAPVVLWTLSREARVLMELKTAGTHADSVFKKHYVWDTKRKHGLTETVKRLKSAQLEQIFTLSAQADRQIKGQQSGDYWETLLHICLLFCGIAMKTNPDNR